MMSEADEDAASHRRPHSKPTAEPYIEVDLAREIEGLDREPEWKSGHNAKTLVKYDTLRVVLIVLKAQSHIPSHLTEGRIFIQTIRGHIQVRAEGRTFSLQTGTLLALDQGRRHDVEALEDSAFLLTIAFPAKAGDVETQGT
jgi:quercetin dioxygenase-like cupin family protein